MCGWTMAELYVKYELLVCLCEVDVTAGDKLIVLKANAGMTLCRAFAVVTTNIHSYIRVQAVRSVER